jgi:ribosomal protein S18 acetylase RimI-like enzyme
VDGVTDGDAATAANHTASGPAGTAADGSTDPGGTPDPGGTDPGRTADPDPPVLRAYEPARDQRAVAELWRRALAPAWPPLPVGLARMRSGVLAVRAGTEAAGRVDPGAGPAAGTAVGFAAYDPGGSIQLIMVDPVHGRRGTGTALLDAALGAVRAAGTDIVALGSGGYDYIWPGVPADLPGARGFFTARGWRWQDTVVDLTADLGGFRAPDGMLGRAAAHGIAVGPAGPAERGEVLAFEAAVFPNWLHAFEHAGHWPGGPGRPAENLLTARDRGGRIVGTLLFAGPDPNALLAPMLGPASGTIGCVGVALDAQRRGVGSAMVARASELLRDAGTRMCHIGWTARETFYRRVGYEPWQRYAMARHRLDDRGRLAGPASGRAPHDTLAGSGLLPSDPA